jgi:hypoxanthine phosphoribosyltransferase
LTDGPRFAHASEAELARILDYYKVEWQYEPHVFPIRWNSDGVVVESFAPDFYLPELEMYVELTTLKQSLVRRKNRKLRYLRELYPTVRIKLFYARDFRALMLKYGRLDVAASLIGMDGQPPPRVDDPSSGTHAEAGAGSPAHPSGRAG